MGIFRALIDFRSGMLLFLVRWGLGIGVFHFPIEQFKVPDCARFLIWSLERTHEPRQPLSALLGKSPGHPSCQALQILKMCNTSKYSENDALRTFPVKLVPYLFTCSLLYLENQIESQKLRDAGTCKI